ncbi:hypothetical protein [Mycolicibacter longobardus]|uniref:hypothetical protein n=1 Tax=Mycolicibacter longobardus TaxID=1108812 RepID=UPI001A983F09|nr:hypothetical protein [Mycolicibacter longobardus]MCV7385519.1 hypothetical protein [Mycolicibacter longobardus]
MNSKAPIWVLDEITVRPGKGPAFLADYLEHYVPLVRRCGLTLAHRLVEPAMWLDDEPNRMLFLWSAPDPETIWRAKHTLRQDPEVLAWWQVQAPPMIECRRRATLAEAGALGVFADV